MVWEQYYFLSIQKWDLSVSDVNMFSFSISFLDTCGSKDFPFHNSYCAVKNFFVVKWFLPSLSSGQIERSMYAFSPVECLDCRRNLTAAGLGWSKFLC